MTRKKLGAAAVVVGVLLVAVSLLADVLGVGGYPEFGWKQAGGLIVGLALVVWGIIEVRREA